MEFSTTRLRERIAERYHTQSNFARVVGWSPTKVSLVLNGSVELRQSEMVHLATVLNISPDEVYRFFFTRRS